MWTKQGNIFNEHHAQVPVADTYSDTYKIYYSARGENGKSIPMAVNFFKEDLSQYSPPIKLNLELGKPGSFDWAGIMPTEIITLKNGIKYLYYIGWSLRQDVTYHNSLGLAISYDNGITWKKYSKGPVFHTNHLEPGYIGSVSILIEQGLWKMWYLSCQDWIQHNNKMEPIYDIKYATSLDGINWTPSGKICIPLENNEGGISTPRVIKEQNIYHMWFSSRNKIDYRINPINSYRIKKATSKDGVNWIREPQNELDISNNTWENIMVCYPTIVKSSTQYLMFYNGNGFGKTGIGYATKPLKI
jgi:hypothetical protein